MPLTVDDVAFECLQLFAHLDDDLLLELLEVDVADAATIRAMIAVVDATVDIGRARDLFDHLGRLVTDVSRAAVCGR